MRLRLVSGMLVQAESPLAETSSDEGSPAPVLGGSSTAETSSISFDVIWPQPSGDGDVWSLSAKLKEIILDDSLAKPPFFFNATACSYGGWIGVCTGGW